jgi:hypothetical protein
LLDLEEKQVSFYDPYAIKRINGGIFSTIQRYLPIIT